MCIRDRTEEGIDFTQSNKSADALSYVVYNMFNATRSTMTDVFTTNDAVSYTHLDVYKRQS